MVEVDGQTAQLEPCHMMPEAQQVVMDKFIEHQIIHIHTHIMSMVILEVLHQELVVLLEVLHQELTHKVHLQLTPIYLHTMLSATS